MLFPPYSFFLRQEARREDRVAHFLCMQKSPKPVGLPYKNMKPIKKCPALHQKIVDQLCVCMASVFNSSRNRWVIAFGRN